MRESWGNMYDLIFRLLPHRAPTGLVRIGNPGIESPVLVTGNYTLTLRRIRQALEGMDAWVLAANSKGINVWCAATGGHLTHHDIIAVVRTSRIGERVEHRRLILPQLGATGIERRKITDATGWETKWGPARLEDLPAYLSRGQRATGQERFMRFPLWERLEMALVWIVPLAVFGIPLAIILGGWAVAAAFAVAMVAVVLALFAALPRLKLRGWNRWIVFGLATAAGLLIATVVLAISGKVTQSSLLISGGFVFGAIAILAIDLEGTTPWYGGAINTFMRPAHLVLDSNLCTGEAECVPVCPKKVLVMDSGRRQVEIVQPEECVQCGACIVQCPTDALYFRYNDGRVVPAQTIRNTRLNMAGRRSVWVGEDVKRDWLNEVEL